MQKTVSLALISLLIAVFSTGWTEARGRSGGAGTLSRQGPPTASNDDGRVVIVVDCSAGHRIGDALKKPARDLVLMVRGICEENVEIRRDNVTLIGTDRAVDGIRETTGAPVVSIRGAVNVTIENLRIIGPSEGISVADSSDEVRFVSCDLLGTGARVTQSSRVSMTDVNPKNLWVELGARLDCLRCTTTGVSAFDGGIVFLRGSRVTHPFGFGIAMGVLRGTVVAESTTFGGSIGADDSTITLDNAEVSLWVELDGISHLELRGASNEFNDRIDVGAFSTVWIEPGSSFRGEIHCYEAGNASCDDVAIDGVVEGCSLCSPEPAP